MILFVCSLQRGILHHKSRNLIIHPLPHRFGSSSHIAYESDNAQVFADMFGSTEANDNVADLLLFEPELSEFEPNESNNSAVRGHGHRTRRRTIGAGSNFSRKIPQILYVETAIFVDKDLFRHMAKNFPKNTEGNLIRFVLAMINGVCVRASVGWTYNNIEIFRFRFNCCITIRRWAIASISCLSVWKYCTPIQKNCDDPATLTYFWIAFVSGRGNSIRPPTMTSFISIMRSYWLVWICMWWARKVKWVVRWLVWHRSLVCARPHPAAQSTRESISKVCSLWPTKLVISELKMEYSPRRYIEKSFSEFNFICSLGMRHDTSENNCDPSLFIMSPTLGSGKITWSKCSQNYLKSFLEWVSFAVRSAEYSQIDSFSSIDSTA